MLVHVLALVPENCTMRSVVYMKLTKHGQAPIAIINVGWDLEEKKVATRERDRERGEIRKKERRGIKKKSGGSSSAPSVPSLPFPQNAHRMRGRERNSCFKQNV